eukprot:scaffold2533_cov266-Chaetoceros_neogracile.AAC.10
MQRMNTSKLARMRLVASPARPSSSQQLAFRYGASTYSPKVFTTSNIAPLASLQARFQSSQSSFAEPEQTLFHADRTTISKEGNEFDKQLRSDVKTMGSILGATIKYFAGNEIYDKVETLRLSAKSWRDAGAGRDETKKDACDDAFKSMTTIASSLSSEELKIVSRAFAHFCAIANAAE